MITPDSKQAVVLRAFIDRNTKRSSQQDIRTLREKTGYNANEVLFILYDLIKEKLVSRLKPKSVNDFTRYRITREGRYIVLSRL